MASGDNIEKLRKLHELYKEGKTPNSGSSDYLKVEFGETTVRLLPGTNAMGGPEQFFVERHEHTLPDGANGTRVVCPRATNNTRCPICEARSKFVRSSDPIEVELGKKLGLKTTHMSNVIVRGREADGPLIWTYGVTIHRKLIDLFFDEEYKSDDGLNFLSPVEGYDFIVKKDKGTGSFPSYDQSRAKRNASPLGSDEDVERWMECRHDLAGNVSRGIFDEDILAKLLAQEMKIEEAREEQKNRNLAAAAKRSVTIAASKKGKAAVTQPPVNKDDADLINSIREDN